MRTLKKLLRSSKGVSLMELVVAMMVFSILVMAVSTVFLPMLQTYYHAVDFAETNPLLDEISNTLLTDINQAKEIRITKNTASNGIDIWTIDLWIKRGGYAEFCVRYSLDDADENTAADVPTANALYLYRSFGRETVDDNDNPILQYEPRVLVHDPDYYRGNFTRGKSVNIQFANVTWDLDTWDSNNPDSGDVIGPFDIVVEIVNVASGQRTSRTYAANPLCL